MLLARLPVLFAAAIVASLLVAYPYGTSGRAGRATSETTDRTAFQTEPVLVDVPISVASADSTVAFDLADQPKFKAGAGDAAHATSAARDQLLASRAFRLSVPFRTQKDGTRFQGSNCGPAALGMVLESFSMVQTNADLRWLTHTYQGTAGMRGGTALEHMATVGGDFGLEPVGLYDGDDFHRWTVDEVRAQVEMGRPVIPLVKYRLLPGHEASGIRYDHYIVIYGVAGDHFLYHDPSYETAEEGAAHWITSGQLDAAMRITLEPRQAVAFAPGVHASLPVLPM